MKQDNFAQCLVLIYHRPEDGFEVAESLRELLDTAHKQNAEICLNTKAA